MDMIKEYLKILAYSLLGLVFAFASFYLLANLYHYLEIRKDFVTDFSKQAIIVNMEDSLSKIKNNVSKFNPNTYTGSVSVSKMTNNKNKILSCENNIQNEEYIKIKTTNRITILDVYNLRESYENNVYNNCIVSNLYWMVNDAPSGLKVTEDLSKYYFESLKSATSYLKKDLINNSSYFYNTSVASASIKDNTKDGYYDVIDAYSKATNYVLYVSEWFRMEVGG